MRRMAALALVATLSGCVSTGTKLSDADVQQFQKGKTTEAEIIAKLGVPTTVVRNDNGTKADIYVHSSLRPDAANFIPYVGLFAGGTKASSSTVTFSFDANGILASVSSQDTNVEGHSGLLNQK